MLYMVTDKKRNTPGDMHRDTLWFRRFLPNLTSETRETRTPWAVRGESPVLHHHQSDARDGPHMDMH